MMRPITATAAPDNQELEALVLMLKNSEENDHGSVSYTDLGAFRVRSLK
ncbi:hypothetical protein L195_g047256 [Trifolium pratense]|uniref:Uncharacterized protein n=1 Tax=Trifolium pratense TaxID=57577 RepID=A0A2K3MJY5_TRIPR|nr:hypothetical protein L195_g047256 [Trifolium pratense]